MKESMTRPKPNRLGPFEVGENKWEGQADFFIQVLIITSIALLTSLVFSMSLDIIFGEGELTRQFFFTFLGDVAIILLRPRCRSDFYIEEGKEMSKYYEENEQLVGIVERMEALPWTDSAPGEAAEAYVGRVLDDGAPYSDGFGGWFDFRGEE